MPINLVMRTPT